MPVDMSDKAITGRLKRVEQLRCLCLSLAKAQLLTSTSKPVQVPSIPGQGKTNNQPYHPKGKL